MIGGRRPLKGRKAGDRRVRVERPHAAYFRYAGPGQLVAREAASMPRTGRGRALARLRQVLAWAELGGGRLAAGRGRERADDQPPRRLTEFGVAGYLPKPFPLETLTATVERLVATRV